jgi:hypothetical protein
MIIGLYGTKMLVEDTALFVDHRRTVANFFRRGAEFIATWLIVRRLSRVPLRF